MGGNASTGMNTVRPFGCGIEHNIEHINQQLPHVGERRSFQGQTMVI